MSPNIKIPCLPVALAFCMLSSSLFQVFMSMLGGLYTAAIRRFVPWLLPLSILLPGHLCLNLFFDDICSFHCSRLPHLHVHNFV